MIMKHRQIGTFKIGIGEIEDNTEMVIAVFAMLRLVPVRAEMLYSEQCVEYTAISERFREVPAAMRYPKYNLIVTMEDNGIHPSLVEVEEIPAGKDCDILAYSAACMMNSTATKL